MEYSIEQINEFADEFINKLINDEYIVESLPNSECMYHGEIEEMYSEAIRNTNPNSRLFKSTYED
ncbi:MAG: hypothetical protein FWH52_03630 [Synergistaceae bacterium]|nr:hypothetical protein [Synergistaceae bacterium]